MARASIIAREAKRARLVSQFAEKRLALKNIIADASVSEKERFQAGLKLQKLPRNSSRVRQRNRCVITGRSGGYYRKFGLCRVKLRETAMRGEIPGLRMASW